LIKTRCIGLGNAYPYSVPRLWNETIETHRHEVREAIMDTTWELVAERGLSSVSMSHIAERTGIGRATLYKYFPDVESILLAWHERRVDSHLQRLTEIRDRSDDPSRRLEAVLQAFAMIAFRRGHHSSELGALLHRGDQIVKAQRQVRDLIRDLLSEAAAAGDIRTDVPPVELATYCLHALTAAGHVRSKAAVQRLVDVTLAGLRPQS
jgi:AcrR family transcriptional regulator